MVKTVILQRFPRYPVVESFCHQIVAIIFIPNAAAAVRRRLVNYCCNVTDAL